ncbi:sensor histidine kinase [Aporhodopirellula aestuarii]|uniref:histidine kinase n=1 Tax=Aporhodopirellula aestuarii TaxID=2950107 RepID=A0ABT0UB92_9BACT|nr:ATP-binding protein [Aporhodopirellula aestuarii]MCM2373601.1 cell wall metabolism sensor histidine kinase WalK [Aporhodopirellula aestuarii]
MNTPRLHHQRLSRRLLSYYLMFGLMSIMTLSLSWMLLDRSQQSQTVKQGLMSRLSDISTQIATDYRTADGTNIQSIVEKLSVLPEFSYCGIISFDGVYQAHTNPELIGRKSARMLSVGSSSGVVERIRYLRGNQPNLCEYWLPVADSQQSYGLMQVAVSASHLETTDGGAVRHAGMTIALPLLLLVLGGIKLHGVVRSSSMIERQLEGLCDESTGETLPISPVEPGGPASIGWNHLVSVAQRSVSLGKLEERLAESLGGLNEEKYGQILQGLSDGIASTNETGRILFANKAFAALLNVDYDATTGSSIEEHLLKSFPEAANLASLHLNEPSRPAVLELHRSNILSDGVLRLARVPLRSKDGKSLLLVWSVRDITQQKMAENARDQFVDNATHELRTPLTNIKACAETLQLEDDVDVELQKQYLNTINNEATRLGRFVDEFLNISRMEAGSLAVTRSNVHVDRLLSEAIAKVKPQMTMKQIDFQVSLPPKLPELKLDKDKIAAALVNLLGNAAKYTPTGGRVTLHVEMSGDTIRIHVEDTGIGIALNELPKVFEKFFRSDDERVRDESGTGLGLAFAQEVIRLHGGKITARSELDHGSRFTINLPLA